MTERERRMVREGNIRLRPCRPTDEEEGAMQKEAAEPRRERSGGEGLRRSGVAAAWLTPIPAPLPDAPGRGRGRAAPCLPAAPPHPPRAWPPPQALVVAIGRGHSGVRASERNEALFRFFFRNKIKVAPERGRESIPAYRGTRCVWSASEARVRGIGGAG